MQQDIYQSFFGSFDLMGKVFDLNRKPDNKLAGKIFRKANNIRVEEIEKFPASFRMGSCSYDKENGIIRYSFTQCPNAEFARRHHMEDVLPVLYNCDHLAMQALLFLEVMNWYDGIVIDRLWVGHSRFWIIPGTEEIPFVQTWPQVLKKRGILTLIWIAGAAIVAGIIVLLF